MGFSWSTFGQNLIRKTHLQNWRLHLEKKGVQLVAITFIIWPFCLDNFHIQICFRMFLIYYIFIYPHKWPFVLPNPHFLLHPSVFFPSLSDSPVPGPPVLSFYNYLFYFAFLGRSVTPLESLTLNLASVVIWILYVIISLIEDLTVNSQM